MIERYQVHFIAKEHLSSRLSTVPSARDFLTTGWRFNKFIDLLHVRCNELIWAIPTKFALVEFIKSATVAYADKQLDKAGMIHGNTKPKEIKTITTSDHSDGNGTPREILESS